MKTHIAFVSFVIILALRIAYHPSQSKTDMSPFASPTPTISVVPANIISPHAGSSERLILKWVIGDNRDGTCFNSAKPVKELYETGGNEPVFQYIN